MSEETTTETTTKPKRVRTAPKKFLVLNKQTADLAINVGVERAAELLAMAPEHTLVFDYNPKSEIHTLVQSVAVNDKFKVKNVVSYEA